MPAPGDVDAGQAQHHVPWGFGFAMRWFGLADEFPAQDEPAVPVQVGVEAVVPDPGEPGRQDMEQEPADELAGIERHDPAPVAAGVVAPAEPDIHPVEVHQPVVGDGGLVGVTPEICHDLCRTVVWRFGVDHPVPGTEQRPQALEGGGVIAATIARQTQVPAAVGPFEQVEVLAPEHPGQRLVGNRNL